MCSELSTVPTWFLIDDWLLTVPFRPTTRVYLLLDLSQNFLVDTILSNGMFVCTYVCT